jgi:hypothetical protein
MKKTLALRRIFNRLRELARPSTYSSKVSISSLKVIAAVILILALTTQAMSLVLTSKTISNSGSVKTVGLGVYWDAALTNTVSSIGWGTINPGSNSNATVYIRNEGDTAVNLTMSTVNWNPSTASNYVTLTSDYGGQSIGAVGVIVVKLTLSVSASTTGITTFSFDINIVASG